jgi:hypothetical protein
MPVSTYPLKHEQLGALDCLFVPLQVKQLVAVVLQLPH